MLECPAAPQLDVLAAQDVERRFVKLMDVGLRALAGGNRDDSEEEAFRSHRLGADRRRVERSLPAFVRLRSKHDVGDVRFRSFHLPSNGR